MNLPLKLLFYSTSDLSIATFLHTVGYQLVETSLLTPSKLTFHFKWEKDIEEKVADFLNGAKAPARRLFETYRQLRALTYERTGNLKPSSMKGEIKDERTNL